MNHSVCNIEYDNELNTRLNSRYFPSQELQPNFDPRPTPTQYTHFMTQDPEIQSKEILRTYPEYKTTNVFFPGNKKAPIHSALQNVDIESLLGNRFMALQKNDQAYYIPSVHSSLYNHVSGLSNKPRGVDPHLMQNTIIKNVNKCNLAPKTFNNSTRYNLKNL